jgi:hypothetical protein
MSEMKPILASPNTALHSPKDKFNAASIVMRTLVHESLQFGLL